MVLKKSLRINPFRFSTGDVARRHGAFYTDKAPGVSLLAAIPVWVGTSVAGISRDDPRHNRAWWIIFQWAILIAVVMPVTWMSVALGRWVVEIGLPLRYGLALTPAIVLATPIWAYGSALWSHGVTGAALVMMFIHLFPSLSGNKRPTYERGMLAGFAAGWSILFEYTSAPAVAILAIAGLCGNPKKQWRDLFFGALVGALPEVILHFVYHQSAFGSPFATGYHFNANQWDMSGRLPGMGTFSFVAAYEILFGTMRGLFFHAPVMVAGAFGLICLASNSRDRVAACGAIAFVCTI